MREFRSYGSVRGALGNERPYREFSAGIDPPLGLPEGRPDQTNGGARPSAKDPGRVHSTIGAIISEVGGAALFRYASPSTRTQTS